MENKSNLYLKLINEKTFSALTFGLMILVCGVLILTRSELTGFIAGDGNQFSTFKFYNPFEFILGISIFVLLVIGFIISQLDKKSVSGIITTVLAYILTILVNIIFAFCMAGLTLLKIDFNFSDFYVTTFILIISYSLIILLRLPGLLNKGVLSIKKDLFKPVIYLKYLIVLVYLGVFVLITTLIPGFRTEGFTLVGGMILAVYSASVMFTQYLRLFGKIFKIVK